MLVNSAGPNAEEESSEEAATYYVTEPTAKEASSVAGVHAKFNEEEGTLLIEFEHAVK